MQIDHVHFSAAPELHRPHLLAAWSGMGAVAILAINFLRQEMEAQELAEIDPRPFFSPSQVKIKDRLVQRPEYPEGRFTYCHRPERDLLFFVGTEQPDRGYEMAQLVLDVAERFGVTQVTTAAAFPTLIHHGAAPGVWGAANDPALLPELTRHGVQIMEQGTIGGLNGLLLAAARERDLPGFCLLGEIPVYTTQMINPRAARAALAVLTRMLGLEVNLGKLTLWAQDLAPQMDRLFKIVPRHVREAIRQAEESEAGEGEEEGPEMVADENFFDEIERFLQQHWQDDDDGEGPPS
jgi:hypothetical protein